MVIIEEKHNWSNTIECICCKSKIMYWDNEVRYERRDDNGYIICPVCKNINEIGEN